MPTMIFAMLEMFSKTFTAGMVTSFAGMVMLNTGMIVFNAGMTVLKAGIPISQTGKPYLKAGIVILGRNGNIFFMFLSTPDS